MEAIFKPEDLRIYHLWSIHHFSGIKNLRRQIGKLENAALIFKEPEVVVFNPVFSEIEIKDYLNRIGRDIALRARGQGGLHEVGHALFALRHCNNPKCVMSFSNTIFDVDRKSKEVCKNCKTRAGLFD